MAYLLHHYPTKSIDRDIDHQNKKGYTAYHFAAEAGQLRILKLLDRKKAKFDALTHQG